MKEPSVTIPLSLAKHAAQFFESLGMLHTAAEFSDAVNHAGVPRLYDKTQLAKLLDECLATDKPATSTPQAITESEYRQKGTAND